MTTSVSTNGIDVEQLVETIGLQRFPSTAHALAAQRRLSRYTFLARRPLGHKEAR